MQPRGSGRQATPRSPFGGSPLARPSRPTESNSKRPRSGRTQRRFARIDLPFDDELLICDDMGTECADFVAASFQQKQLAFIHAKAGPGAGVSASSFHDVVAQAIKNLVYLTRNSDIPAGLNSWSRSSKWNNTSIPRIIRRPQGCPEKANLWRRLKTDIISSSNPGLFVVLVTTGCCGLPRLHQAATDSARRTPQTAQLFHLLDGLSGYARQLGVRLLIRDIPFAD